MSEMNNVLSYVIFTVLVFFFAMPVFSRKNSIAVSNVN